jgi:hypothetical protein
MRMRKWSDILKWENDPEYTEMRNWSNILKWENDPMHWNENEKVIWYTEIRKWPNILKWEKWFNILIQNTENINFIMVKCTEMRKKSNKSFQVFSLVFLVYMECLRKGSHKEYIYIF